MAGEWRESTVGEIAAPVRNALVGGPFGSKLVSRDYADAGVPVIRGQNMGGRWVAGEFAYVNNAKADSLDANLARPGDIVFTQRGTLGQVSVVPSARFDRYLVSQSQMKLTVNRELADPLFIYYVFSTAEQQNYILQNAIQTGVPHTNLGILRRTPVSLPPLPEQRAIAHILGTLDDKIELNRRMNETLEAMARALFKSWFVDFDPVRAKAESRDPGLRKPLADLFPARLVDSELGEIPEGWRASVLGEELTRCGGRIQTGPFGSQLHASDYVADGVPVVMPKDLSRRRVSTQSIARVNIDDAERLSRHRLQQGDIVYSRRGDVEQHGLVHRRETGWLCGTGCLLVRPGPKWPSPLWVSIAFDRPESRAWIVQHAIGATMPNLNTGILARVPLVVPPDEFLWAFDRLARPLADKAISADAQTATLVSLRDALLPKLISGELRVKDAEKFVDKIV